MYVPTAMTVSITFYRGEYHYQNFLFHVRHTRGSAFNQVSKCNVRRLKFKASSNQRFIQNIYSESP